MARKSEKTVILYGTLVISLVSILYLLFPQILVEMIGDLFIVIESALLIFVVVFVAIMITQSHYDRRN